MRFLQAVSSFFPVSNAAQHSSSDSKKERPVMLIPTIAMYTV